MVAVVVVAAGEEMPDCHYHYSLLLYCEALLACYKIRRTRIDFRLLGRETGSCARGIIPADHASWQFEILRSGWKLAV